MAEVAKYCDSALGSDRVVKVRPMWKYEEIRKLLQQTNEMSLLLQYEDNFPHDRIHDIRETTNLLKIENYVLSELQFHEINKVALLAGNIIRFFKTNAEKYPILHTLISDSEYIPVIPNEIKKVITPEGTIRPDASPELIQIKKEKDSAIRSLAVSYTHLRAHETVLDLVCRLLLEKKKIRTKVITGHKQQRHSGPGIR